MKNHNSKFFNNFTRFVLACLLAAFACSTAARAQTLDPTLQGNVQGAARLSAMAFQPDGKIIVAGGFTFVGNTVKNQIARLNADETLDNTFDSGAGVARTGCQACPTSVQLIALQPDGKILISGFFDTYNGVSKGRLARLNADGTLDNSFITPAGNPEITAITLQTDGKILIGGYFVNLNGVAQKYLARLNADGSGDGAFNSQVAAGFDQNVSAIAVQPDGKILVGGAFTKYFGNNRGSIARLNADGTFDAAFNNGAGANSSVAAIALQTDGKVLIGGNFTTVNGTSRSRIARLNSDASLDASFNPGAGADNFVTALALQTDGGVLIGGAFSAYNGTPRNSIARLNADGSLDNSFNVGTGISGVSRYVNVFAVQANKIYVGGRFDNYNNAARSGVVRLNSDGSLDPSFNTNVFQASGIGTMVLQTDGKILISGDFNGYNGTTRNRIARLNADGSLDASFNAGAGADGQVNVIVPQPDGKILIAGLFSTFNGVPRKYFARLNADGSLDAAFNNGAGVNDYVYAVALQTDGKILIGGFLTDYNGTAVKNLARLNADGSIDSSFASRINSTGGYVAKIVIQSNGKVLVGGLFNNYDGVIVNGIVRVNADGSFDNSFGANLSQFSVVVDNIVLQPDGKILITGNFTPQLRRLNADGSNDSTFDASAANPNGTIHAVIVQTDGEIIIAGSFTTVGGAPRNYIARLTASGAPDSFNSCTAGPNGEVASIVLQSGSILLGGYFTTFNGIARNGIARVSAGEVSAICRRTPFDFDGDGRADISVFRSAQSNWFVNLSSNGFLSAQFGSSSDKLAPADYDNDGKADLAVYRSGLWIILQSSNSVLRYANFGTAEDLPRPADFDGDGKADISVWRPSSGYWYRLNSTDNSFQSVQFGQTNDSPMIGDYDGDGRSDCAVFRPAGGVWFILRSSDNQVQAAQFGLSSDIPLNGDFTGDGRADLAVYRPSNGFWFYASVNQNAPAQNFNSLQFGASGDVPVPADYDGDGKTDRAVFRGGQWIILQSQTNQIQYAPFGLSSDKPVPAVYQPQ